MGEIYKGIWNEDVTAGILLNVFDECFIVTTLHFLAEELFHTFTACSVVVFS